MATYPKVSLNGVACEDASGAGLYALHPEHPPRVTAVPTIQGVTVPGRDGSIWTPQGSHSAPLFTVTLILAGITAGRDSQYATIEDLQDLWGRVASSPRVSIVHQTRASGTGAIRYAEARLASFDLERTSLDYAKLTMVFEIPGAFWADSDTGSTSVSFTQAAFASNTLYTVAADGGTAPLLDAQVRLTGPVVNPVFTDNVTGDWFRYAGTVVAGNTLRFDVNSLRAYLGTTASVTWTSTAGEVSSLISVGGTGQYIPTTVRLMPAFLATGGIPSIGGIGARVVATGLTAASKLEVQGRRAYR